YTFREACGWEACPQRQIIVDWLQANAEQIGRLVEPELNAANAVVFDLSVGSREIGDLSETADVALFTNKLFERVQKAKARVGIGRYNEARAIYTSDIFKHETNAGFEARTIHIGLDLFLEAGASVFAPLAGIVHSFQNNDAPLDYGPTIILQHDVADGRV